MPLSNISAADLLALNTPVEEQQLPTDEFELFIYSKAIIRLKELIASWTDETAKTKARRKERYVNVDVEQMRKNNVISPDETFIPDRLIDTNIRREQPEYIAFLKQSRRLAIFNCRSNPSLDKSKQEQLEAEFTSGLTYLGWINEFFRELDGAQTHGWASIEVVYDNTKPLHISFEYIRHEHFLFDLESIDPQNDEFVLRKYIVTANKLEEWVNAFGFDRDQTSKILETFKNKRNKPISIYKKYCKYNNEVYVSWFCPEHGTSDWLKPPEKLLMGLVNANAQPVPIDIYPIFVLPYVETEEEEIYEVKGRGFLDSSKQEATTSLITSFINGMLRASDTYAAPSQPDDSGAMRQLDRLERGKIYPYPLTFFHQDYPDPGVLRALQFIDVSNAQETGQTDFAVNNREDSRKTAREVTAGMAEANLLKSVKLAIYSEHLRSIFAFCWRIVQSEALQNKIQFLLTQIQVPVILGGINTGNTLPKWQNDFQTINQIYDIKPAGDQDVLVRAEILQNMMQDWPVIVNTPIALTFLSDFLRLRYPNEQGRKYAEALLAGDPKKTLIQQLASMLQTLITPEDIAALPSEQQNQLKQLQLQTQQVLQQP